LIISCTVDLSKFGCHKVDFLIATGSGKTDTIAKSLLKRDEVVYVGKSIGQNTIDPRVETILKDNTEILRMIELLKATPASKMSYRQKLCKLWAAKPFYQYKSSASSNNLQVTDRQADIRPSTADITIEPFELIFQFFLTLILFILMFLQFCFLRRMDAAHLYWNIVINMNVYGHTFKD